MGAAVTEPVRSATFAVEIAVGGLLFDMDGILVSSTSGDERCWTRWAARHLPGQPFDLRRTHGRRAVDTIRDHFQTLDRARIEAHLAELDTLAGEEQCEITSLSRSAGIARRTATVPVDGRNLRIGEDDADRLAVATSHRAEELREADWIVTRLAEIEVRIDETATLNLSFPALVRGA